MNGQYGMLKLKADGSYTYTRNAGTPGGVSDVFTYTLTDGDGDTATATLTINIGDSTVQITDLTPEPTGDATVNEKGLPSRGAGEPEGSGEEAAAGANGDTSEVGTGTFKVSAPDGVKDVTVGGTLIIDEGVLVPGAIVINTPLGNQLTITGYNAGTGEISYSYKLLDNETHASVRATNNLFDNLAVTVTDTDGDAANGTLAIKIVDDIADAKNDTDSVAAGTYGRRPAT